MSNILEQPISYNLLQTVNSILTNNNPIILGQGVLTPRYFASGKTLRVTGSKFITKNGQKIFWQLPDIDKKLNFDVIYDIDVRYILYNALICYIIHTKKYKNINNGEIIWLNNLDKHTVISYTCAFLQRNISTSYNHTHLLSTVLKLVWYYYLNNTSKFGQTPRTNDELLQTVFWQSINNQPFDYLTDGVNIIEIYEQEPPF